VIADAAAGPIDAAATSTHGVSWWGTMTARPQMTASRSAVLDWSPLESNCSASTATPVRRFAQSCGNRDRMLLGRGVVAAADELLLAWLDNESDVSRRMWSNWWLSSSMLWLTALAT